MKRYERANQRIVLIRKIYGNTVQSDDNKKPLHLGFLTALGNPRQGLIGGFLVLNLVGRPAEFHCTAPVRPNRAQEILYGATLEGFVCGEQIAPALVGRTRLELAAILTNSPSMLTASRLLNIPVGLVMKRLADNTTTSDSSGQFAEWNMQKDGVKIETASGGADSREKADGAFFSESLAATPSVPGVDFSQWRETTRGRNRLAFPASFESETLGVVSFDDCIVKIDPFLKSIDSVEPFERIRLAVEEAQKSC